MHYERVAVFLYSSYFARLFGKWLVKTHNKKSESPQSMQIHNMHTNVSTVYVVGHLKFVQKIPTKVPSFSPVSCFDSLMMCLDKPTQVFCGRFLIGQISFSPFIFLLSFSCILYSSIHLDD